MKICKRNYRIAEIVFGVSFLPKICFNDDENIGDDFVVASDESEVTIHCCCMDETGPRPRIGVGMHNETIWVERRNEKILRWEGDFSGPADNWKYSFMQKFPYRDRKNADIYIESKSGVIAEKTLFRVMGLDLLLSQWGRFILHSSYLSYNGEAILFTAPSGGGKSTQAALWEACRPGSEIINGDRSILSCDEGIPMVHSLPLCGSSGIAKNRKMPIRAIVVLGKADENQITVLSKREAFRSILSESAVHTWDSYGTEKITDVLLHILEKVPVCRLECRPDETAVECLEKWMGR